MQAPSLNRTMTKQTRLRRPRPSARRCIVEMPLKEHLTTHTENTIECESQQKTEALIREKTEQLCVLESEMKAIFEIGPPYCSEEREKLMNEKTEEINDCIYCLFTLYKLEYVRMKKRYESEDNAWVSTL